MTKFSSEFIAQQRELVRMKGCGFLEDDWRYREAAANNYPAALDEIERLREALAGLMEFHPEDELGPTTEEYWTPEYKAAINAARNALGPA